MVHRYYGAVNLWGHLVTKIINVNNLASYSEKSVSEKFAEEG